jgi:serine/threonine protein kinase
MTTTFPRQFGKYVLLKTLAKGGMGEIYMAAHGQLDGFDKLCVIKKVIPEKTDAGKAKRFLDEAKVVLRLTHSGLVNTFDAGQVDREFYIAMEMVEGKDLREVWNRCVRVRHRIPIEVALHVAREVARALSYVHAYGDLNLVHRDVAPPNILLAYNGDVKLTDFGLARSALKEEHTQPGVVFGRAAYLAPEQARGEVADPRTDVYSLAVVLWELLTGHQYLQITGLDPAAALALVRHPKPMPPSTRAPWITPVLDQVLQKALAPDRAKRYQTAQEFRHALSEAIAESAPRTDAARVSELMHAIYAKVIAEEREERDRFVKELLPSFRAATSPSPDAGMDESPATEGGPADAGAPSPAEQKARKRAAAMQVLAELAKETSGN